MSEERKNNNRDLLTAVVLLERARDQMLKIESRSQLSKTQLNIINQSITQAVSKIVGVGLNDTYILSYLLSVTQIIEKLVEDETFSETDLQQKDILAKKVCEALDRLYIKTGEYYETHDFEYSTMLEPVLVRIVDRCVAAGMTFGIEV